MPVQGKKKKELTVEYILSKLDDTDVYKYYMGRDFTEGKATHSPFRQDENPSFCISRGNNGRLHHIDFADSTKKGSCVDLVMQLYNLNLVEALLKIDNDFCLGIKSKEEKEYIKTISNVTHTPEEPSLIQVVSRPFDTADLAYWNQYTIDRRDLKENDVYAVKKLYINGRKIPQKDTDMIFGYLYEDRWKIYKPFATRKDKWKMNFPNNWMSGLHRIKPGSDVTLVTKAKKDEMILSKLVTSTCSTQNESEDAITKDNLSLLQANSDRVLINFDSDETGVRASRHFNQYGFGWINCPGTYVNPEGKRIKDFADLVHYYGMDELIKLFKHKNLI